MISSRIGDHIANYYEDGYREYWKWPVHGTFSRKILKFMYKTQDNAICIAAAWDLEYIPFQASI